jgi:hypothetical protein
VLVPHSIHVLAKEAPKVVEYLPAVHSTQELAIVAPVVVRYFPAPQAVHATVPVITLYFPSPHAVQLPPFDPVYPGLHRQLVEPVEPLVD